jgi:hypothetical protein
MSLNPNKKVELKNKADKSNNKAIFIVMLMITFFYMLFLNSYTPLIADDYVYRFIFGTAIPVNSMGDIVTSQTTYYMTWGGRVIAESLTQVFVFLGKPIFNIANSICYIVFILGIYFNAVGRKIKPIILLWVIILLWLFIPMFGQTVMWLTGSCNYLWCGTLIILAILPFRLFIEKQTLFLKSFSFGIIMSPLFFLSGVTNENTAGGMILIMLLFCFVYYKQKIKIPYFAYTGLFFSICGFACMIFAPGNGMRVDNESAVKEVVAMVGSNPIVTRFAYFANNLYMIMPVLIFVGVGLVILFNQKGKKGLIFPSVFIIAAAASMVVMLIPPKFPPRAMFGLVSFLIIAITMMMDEIDWSLLKRTKGIVLPVILVSMFFMMSLGYAGVDAIMVTKAYNARVTQIQEEIGKETIEVSNIVPITSHNGMYGLRDVQMDSNHWVNRALADYYGVPNIVLKP